IVLTLNDQVVARVNVDHPIAPPQFSNSRTYIGGDLFQRYFPGYVDDVRILNIVGIDIVPPTITLVEPSSFQLQVPRPTFSISLEDDDSGIDSSRVQVFLNNVLQENLAVTPSSITGQMDQDMISTILNEVKVVAYDILGNKTEKKFFFTITNISERNE